MASTGVVVWEWQNEFGGWRPYDPKICIFLESYKSSTTPLQLGAVDPKLHLYVVDIQNMRQVRQGTGTQRPMRRTVYSGNSAIGQGITWQWEGDVAGHWNDFDAEITEYLEDHFTNKNNIVDLSRSRFNLPYFVDLVAMTQTRIQTNRVRNIQRLKTSSTYPPDGSSSSGKGKRQHNVPVNNIKTAAPKRLKVNASANTQSACSSSTAIIPSGGNYFSSQPASTSTAMTLVPMAPMNFQSFSHQHQTHQGALSSLPQSTPVIQFGGPITRRRYTQNLAQMARASTQVQPSVSQSGTMSGSIASSSMLSAPLRQQAGYQGSVHQQPMNPGLSHQMPAGAGQPSLNLQNNMAFSLPQSGHYYGVGNMTGFPPTSGFSGPALGHTSMMTGSHYPSQGTSSGHTQAMFQSGCLNPSQLLQVARPGRVRPSASGPTFTLPPYDRIPNSVPKTTKRSKSRASTPDTFLDTFVLCVESPPTDEDCCICYERLAEASGHGSGSPEDALVIQLDKCSHMFHKLCLHAMYNSGPKDHHLQCPSCKTIYGEKVGNCPRGELEYRLINAECTGYEGCRTYQVLYHIQSGIQGPEHPTPNKRFSTRGFPRVGYIPDCDKGRKVLQLLIVAWKRRLTFTIGTSTTTGEDNTVTWNEIHHKTELGSNFSGHGFPDENYLDNVLMELAIHGITDKDLPS